MADSIGHTVTTGSFTKSSDNRHHSELPSCKSSDRNFNAPISTPLLPSPPPKVVSPVKEPAVRAPSPPRWRFVKEPKMAVGYSSRDAGTFVVGKSSKELAAEYVAPEESPINERATMHRMASSEQLVIPDMKYSVFTQERRQSSKMEIDDLRYSKFHKSQDTVGKLSNTEAKLGMIEVLEGGVVISHEPATQTEPDIGSRVWANYHQRSPKGISPINDYDKDAHTNLMESEDTPNHKFKGVGKLKFMPSDPIEASFEGEIPRKHIDKSLHAEDGDTADVAYSLHANDTAVDDANDDVAVDKDLNIDSNLSPHAHDVATATVMNIGKYDKADKTLETTSSDIDEEDDDVSISKGVMTDSDSITERRNRRRNVLLLLLIPLLLVAIIAGVVVVGKKNRSDETGRAIVIVPPILNPNTTIQPSSMPSAIPSYQDASSSSIFDTGSVVVTRPWSDDEEEQDEDEPQVNLFDIQSTPESLAPSTLDITMQQSTPPLTNRPATNSPSKRPTLRPEAPSLKPSQKPLTDSPSEQPMTDIPTMQPTQKPITEKPTMLPTAKPMSQTTANPTTAPTRKDSSVSSSSSVITFTNTLSPTASPTREASPVSSSSSTITFVNTPSPTMPPSLPLIEPSRAPTDNVRKFNTLSVAHSYFIS